jgi:hypothetical protein
MASANLEERRIEALACFDSFGKTAMCILQAARAGGARTALHLLELPGRKLSRRQVLEIRRIDPRTPIQQHSWGDLHTLAQELADLDGLVLGLDGRRTREIQLSLRSQWRDRERRPLLISAYPGILFRHQLEGMMDRSGMDLLCLNSEPDAQLYREACAALGLNSDHALVTGLPILWPLQQRHELPAGASIVFFEQPSVPNNPIQRRYLCQRLAALAEAWPDHPVIFKPRTSGVEATLHRHHGEMASRIAQLKLQHPNLGISYKPSLKLLKTCGCAITVSSTAALEAMALGVSTRIVADLGVNETLGNHYFVGSGALADFDAIIRDPFTPNHHQDWLESHGLRPDGRTRFLEELAQRLDQPAPRWDSDLGTQPGWGSHAWQTYALEEGGTRMLASAGARSKHKPSHRSRNLLRRLRRRVVGFWLLERWVKGR